MAWSNYFVGMELRWRFSFSSGDMLKFSFLSGDFNPVHSDEVFAKSKGFDAPIVYGMLLSTQMSRLIGQELPDHNCILTGIKNEFISPSYVDEDLDFVAKLVTKSESTHALEFKCLIKRLEKTLCRGKVEAIWKP